MQFAKHVSLTNHLISSIICDFHNEIQSESFNVALFQELELLGLLYGLFQQFISFDQRLVKTFCIVSRSSAAVRILNFLVASELAAHRSGSIEKTDPYTALIIIFVAYCLIGYYAVLLSESVSDRV